MADKSWMLNPTAIRHANECIQQIKLHTGERLKLSQPDFLLQLHRHVEKIQSQKLGIEYAHLLSLAGVSNVLQSFSEPAQAVVAQPRAMGDHGSEVSEETVEINGKHYPRYRNGRQISGVIHGIPRYR